MTISNLIPTLFASTKLGIWWLSEKEVTMELTWYEQLLSLPKCGIWQATFKMKEKQIKECVGNFSHN
jgi:hypothetical protein